MLKRIRRFFSLSFTQREQNRKGKKIQKKVQSCGKHFYVFGNIKIDFPDKLIIGDWCKFNDLVYINATSGVYIGDDVTLSRGSSIISTGYDMNEFFTTGQKVHFSNRSIRIGNHCWIGAGAIILPGVQISGEYVVVGAGTVVTKDIIESRVVVAGNPARIVKRMDDNNAK